MSRTLSGGLAGGVGLSLVPVFGVAVTMALVDKAGRGVFTVPQQWIALVIFVILGFWSGAPAPLVLGYRPSLLRRCGSPLTGPSRRKRSTGIWTG